MEAAAPRAIAAIAALRPPRPPRPLSPRLCAYALDSIGVKSNVLRQACALAGPAGSISVSLASVNVKGERPAVDAGLKNKPLTGRDDEASLDESSSSLAKSGLLMGAPAKHTIRAAVVDRRWVL